MTSDQNRFFFDVIGDRWGEGSMEALVDEEKAALYQDMLNAVEKQLFHEAALLRGRIEAWDAVIPAFRRRAAEYRAPQTER